MTHGPGDSIATARRRNLVMATLLYVCVTLILAFPLWVRPGQTMLPLGPDGELVMWLLSWDTHALVHHPWSIFDANAFYPLHHTLAFAENLIGSAFFAAPVLWITGNPVLALNVVSLLACALCGLGTYVLARRLGLGQSGALIAGLVFAFSPVRFFRLGQLHLAAVQWIPFALACLHAYLGTGRRRDLRLAALCFSLQALSSGHGMVFLSLAAAALAIYALLHGEPLAPARRLADLGVAGALLLLPAALAFVPYLFAQQEVGLRRSLENWAVTPESFIAAPTHLQAWLLSFTGHRSVLDTASAYLFPGYLPLALAAAAVGWGVARRMAPAPGSSGRWWRVLAGVLDLAVAVLLVAAITLTIVGSAKLRIGSTTLLSSRTAWRPWVFFALATALRVALARRVPFEVRPRLRRAAEALRRRWAERRSSMLVFYSGLTLVSVWLSVGPPLGIWPLVYWLPGLNFIRVPSRFTVLAALGLAVLAGMGFDCLTARLHARRRLVAAVILGVLLVGEFSAMPIATVPYRFEVPMVDRWLDGRPKPFAIAEVPSPDPSMSGPFERRQTLYLLHSTAHWQKTVHGYGGILPPLHERLYRQIARFPDEESLQRLTALGVTYVVVHTELYPSGEWPDVAARLDQYDAWLRLEHVAGAGRVYSLHRPATR